MLTRGVVVVGAGSATRACTTLHRVGVSQVDEVPGGALADALRAVAAVLRDGHRTLLVDADAVVSEASLGRLADDPSSRTALLVTTGTGAGAPVRTVHGMVLSAATTRHHVSEPDAGSLGVLVVQPADGAAAAAAVEELADCAAAHGWQGDVVDHVAVAVVRRAVPVRAIPATGPAVRTQDPAVRADVVAALDGGEDERALRESGNRVDDGFYSTFVLRRLSKPLTEVALRLGLSPNQVSLLSFGIGLVAAVLFALGETGPTVAAALLLQLSIVVDCVDGEVARRTRRFSDLGAWLDASTDRVKEYAVYAGLAVAATDDVWLLAGAVLLLQTVRHMTDYDFNRVQRRRETWVAPRALDVPDDGGAPSYGAALDASRRASRRQGVRWVKKAVHLPIGERWLVISVLSVVAGPLAVLVALLALGLLAAAYTTAGRLLRVRTWDHPADRSGREVLLPQLDLGPLASRVWHPTLAGRSGWAVPALLRLVELGLLLGVTAALAPDAMPWAYGLAFVLAYHHYDTLYRALGGGAPPRWLVVGGLGVDGRLVVGAVAAVLGAQAWEGFLVVATVVLGAWFVGVASAQFVRSLSGAHR